MNWKCFLGSHGEWEYSKLPFTNETLRKCLRCQKMYIRTPNGWIPFEGAVAVVGLSFALNEMQRKLGVQIEGRET